MYRFGIIWLTLLMAWPSPALLAMQNAGIVDGIWLSNPVPVENQPTRIYVAIHNTTDGDLEGTVYFRVNDLLLDTMRINALSGRIIESWADWVPQAGTSTISVNLRRTELASNASGTQEVTVVQPLTVRTFYIDSDTDGDGEGNLTDADDDNDGTTDADEAERGTDPLVYNEPPEPEPKPQPDRESNSDESNETEESDTAVIPAARDGLESLVAESNFVHTPLARSSAVIADTKQALDNYREQRVVSPQSTGTVSELSSTTPEEASWLHNVLSTGYTIVLFTLSWLLGYPWLVQLLLLVLTLYFLYRLARYYGRRPDF
jgi:hypothetical protein